MRIGLSGLLGWCLAAMLFAPAMVETAAAGEGVVGLALPSDSEPRWQRDLAVARVVAEDGGVNLKIRMANGTQEKQDEQIDELMGEGINVLMVAAHDTGLVVETIKRVRDKGVKVIAYDRIVNDCEYELYIGFDSVKVGEIQGEWMIAQVPEGNYVVMSGASTDANAALFRSGVDKVLAPKIASGAIKIVNTDADTKWDPAVAEKLMLDVLATGVQVDAIIAPNDGTAGGIVKALESKGLAGKIPVAGHDGQIDAVQRILDGTQSMTVFKDVRMLSETGMQMAARLSRPATASLTGVPGIHDLANGSTKVKAILIEPIMVDKDNIQAVFIDSGYMKFEGDALKEIE